VSYASEYRTNFRWKFWDEEISSKTSEDDTFVSYASEGGTNCRWKFLGVNCMYFNVLMGWNLSVTILRGRYFVLNFRRRRFCVLRFGRGNKLSVTILTGKKFDFVKWKTTLLCLTFRKTTLLCLALRKDKTFRGFIDVAKYGSGEVVSDVRAELVSEVR
jgi:hypothetical protein